MRSMLKDLIIIWQKSQWIVWLLRTLYRRHTSKITMYYRGSFAGDVGDHLIKFKRLKNYFIK